ncbi:MAG: hypothetical protein Q7R70_03060 [Candidatus Diapherotrites archaeon]|nr:hypothetical protein [Candidatus Diapherotrites archaeon]
MPQTTNKTKKIFAKSAIQFIIGVILATLFFWTMIEGLLEQIANNHTMSFGFYFLAFLAGIAAIYNYIQAKELFHFAKLEN